MTDVTVIFGEVVERVSEKVNLNVRYLFGDWGYISNQLLALGNSPETSCTKYPLICLFSPFRELNLPDGVIEVNLQLLIAVNALRDQSNEYRRHHNFHEFLYPVYKALLAVIREDTRFDTAYTGIPHSKEDNYRYARKGVKDDNGKEFADRFDGIDIYDLQLTIKKENKCYAKKIKKVQKATKL